MPICTPQLCFGNTAPSYNGEQEYNSYSLSPATIELGIFEIKDGFCIWGESYPNYPGTNMPNVKYNEFMMRAVYTNVKILGSKDKAFFGKTPSYRFISKPKAEIIQQITSKIVGSAPAEDVQDSIKNEIANRLLDIVTNDNCQEACSDLVKFSYFNSIDDSKPSIPNPINPSFTQPITVYKAITGGQMMFDQWGGWAGRWQTKKSWIRQRFKISVNISSIDFCKKVSDQFGLDPTTIKVDPKWQKILVSEDINTTYCDCLQITYFPNDIIKTEMEDERFLEPESAAEFAQQAVTSNSTSNRVAGGFGPLVNSSTALALMQDMANRAKPGQLKYGYLGNVIGFLTKYTTLDGPLVEIGWVIPLTADMNGNNVLSALSNPLLKIGLNEARQLTTNPYGYFQTVKDSLIAAGFGPTIPSYNLIDNDIKNGGVNTVEATATFIDLNGTPTSTNIMRSQGAGVVNSAGLGGNYQIINHNQFLQDLRSKGTK